jgi:hypothetical protein
MGVAVMSQNSTTGIPAASSICRDWALWWMPVRRIASGRRDRWVEISASSSSGSKPVSESRI